MALSEVALKPAIASLPRARIIAIIDGDTVIVQTATLQLKIRLDSIDCPEDGQHWGDVAKFGLIKLIGGKSVRLEMHGLDTHLRTLATIYVWDNKKSGWMNVNERMVTLGHAWVMRKYYDHLPPDRKQKLTRLETWSKSKRVGLWQFDNPVPPWRWRRETEC